MTLAGEATSHMHPGRILRQRKRDLQTVDLAVSLIERNSGSGDVIPEVVLEQFPFPHTITKIQVPLQLHVPI